MGTLNAVGTTVRSTMPRLLIVTATALAVLIPGTAARAEPSVAEIESQITTEWSSLEPTIEQYNRVHNDLQANQAKKAEIEKNLQPLELQVEMALGQVGVIAAQSYKRGSFSTFNAMLNNGSGDNLAEQLAIINMLSRKQRAEISTVVEARDKLAVERKRLDGLVTQLKTQDTDLATRRKSIEERVTTLETLRKKVAVTTGSQLCPVDGAVTAAAQAAVRRACAQIGKPYVFGAEGPSSFDCSGLTKFAWLGSRVLEHDAAAQQVTGTQVSRGNLRTGDLVFWGSPAYHVGIYIGGGRVVHAPQPGQNIGTMGMDAMGSPSKYMRVG